MSGRNYLCPNFPPKLRSVLVGLAVAGISSLAMAEATTPESISFRLNPANNAGVLNFQPFDLSLGTLESVLIGFDVTRRYDLALWNISGRATNGIAYSQSLTGTTFSLNGSSYSFEDVPSVLENTGPLASVSPFVVSGEDQAGFIQFLAGGDPLYPSAFNPPITLTQLTDSFSPLSFDGTLALLYYPGERPIGPPNTVTSSLVDVAGTATVTYQYKAITVPDSRLGLVVPLLLWFGLLAVARSRWPELMAAN